jgi:hypothetical protein
MHLMAQQSKKPLQGRVDRSRISGDGRLVNRLWVALHNASFVYSVMWTNGRGAILVVWQ